MLLFLRGLVEEGQKVLPPQTTPAEPVDEDAVNTKVAPHGLCSSLSPMPDIAVTYDPDFDWIEKHYNNDKGYSIEEKAKDSTDMKIQYSYVFIVKNVFAVLFTCNINRK